jgi:hypothetical protein
MAAFPKKPIQVSSLNKSEAAISNNLFIIHRSSFRHFVHVHKTTKPATTYLIPVKFPLKQHLYLQITQLCENLHIFAPDFVVIVTHCALRGGIHVTFHKHPT